MPPEIAILVKRYGLGLITYGELHEAVCSYLTANPHHFDSLLLSLRGLPDPLLKDFAEDVKGTMNYRPAYGQKTPPT